MNTRLAVILLAVILLFSSAAIPGGALSGGQGPEQILQNMSELYASCSSYKDTGSVETVYYKGDRKHTDRKPFTTAFLRTGQFRYEFQSRRGEYEFDRFLIWRSGDDVRTWWDVRPGIETDKSLQVALAGAAGVSGGSSMTVPALLMLEVRKGRMVSRVVGLEAPMLLEDGTIDSHDGRFASVDCYRIQGTSSGAPLTLWIEKQRLLLRRVETHHELNGFRTETTMEYEPEIDTAIARDLLVFDPPTEDK